jgi:hypothetical protein
MEFKIAATAGGGVGVCARTGTVTSAARITNKNKIRSNLIAFPYNTIEMQSQVNAKKTDAAR